MRAGYDENGDQQPLPKTARRMIRYLGGSFVIVPKAGPYNAESGTYDARHDEMGAERFRQYVQNVVDAVVSLDDEWEGG